MDATEFQVVSCVEWTSRTFVTVSAAECWRECFGPPEKTTAAVILSFLTRSTIGGGRGCNKFVPVLGGNGKKIAPTGDIFDQPPGEIR